MQGPPPSWGLQFEARSSVRGGGAGGERVTSPARSVPPRALFPQSLVEIPAIQGLKVERGLLPQERPAPVATRAQRLRIGVPGEAANDERRVALAPYAAEILVSAGHDVIIEAGAGRQAHFADNEYSEVGAEVVEGASAVYGAAD